MELIYRLEMGLRATRQLQPQILVAKCFMAKNRATPLTTPGQKNPQTRVVGSAAKCRQQFENEIWDSDVDLFLVPSAPAISR
jgi:hypothetical protein